MCKVLNCCLVEPEQNMFIINRYVWFCESEKRVNGNGVLRTRYFRWYFYLTLCISPSPTLLHTNTDELIYANIHQNVNYIFRRCNSTSFCNCIECLVFSTGVQLCKQRAGVFVPCKWLRIRIVSVPPSLCHTLSRFSLRYFFLLYPTLALCKEWTLLSVCLNF